MKKINLKTLINYFDWRNNSSIYMLWLFLFLGLIIFTPYIEEIPEKYLLLNDKIVKPLSFKIIYFITLIYTVVKLYNYIKNHYIISNFLKLIIYLSTLYYLYLRIFSREFNFISIFNNKFLVYSDLLIIVLLLILILEYVCFNIFYKSENIEVDEKLHYLSDEIYSFNEEEYSNYEYKDYIEEIVESVNSMNSERAFTIAINSKWGTGKTTFMKAIEDRLINKKAFIVINFNVWKFDSKEALLKDYFSELNNRFKEYSGNSTNTINEYFSNLFLYAGLNFKSLVDNVFTDFFTGKKNPHDNTKRLIERIDKKIIVLIDDLDRLKSDEINQTLKLIRNNSEFKNFFIISTIDEDYLIKEGELKTNFLEKVFNLQINLPFIPSFELYNYYLFQLKKIEINHQDIIIKESNLIFNKSRLLNDEIFFDFDLIDSNKPSEYKPSNHSYFDEILTSRRQVNRFINQLKISLVNIKNKEDVILKKYILYQLLIFRFPIMRTFLNEKYLDKILIVKDGIIKYDGAHIDKINNENNLFENKDDILIVKRFLSRIFTFESNDYGPINIENNDICLLNYFPVYYNQNIYSQTIDLSEIKLSIQNRSIEDLFNIYKEKPHFDKEILTNICLINENYSNIDQVKSFFKLIKDDFFDNIHIIEVIKFINKLDKSYYTEIFNILFSDYNIKNNKVIIHYFKFFVLIYSEVNESSFTINNISLQHITKFLESNQELKKYLSKEVILKKLYEKFDEAVELYKTNDYNSSDFINLILRCYYKKNNATHIFYFEDYIEKKFKNFIENSPDFLKIIFTNNFNIIQEEILFIFFNNESKKKIDESKEYYKKSLNSDEIRNFRKELLSDAFNNFILFLEKINIEEDFINEIKLIINKNISKI